MGSDVRPSAALDVRRGICGSPRLAINQLPPTIATHQVPPTNCHQPIATNQLSPTNCHQPIVTNQLPPTNCHQTVATNQLSPTNYHQQIATNQLSPAKLPPTDCHQAIATNQLPPINCHQPNVTNQLPPTNCPLLCLLKLLQLTCGVIRPYNFALLFLRIRCAQLNICRRSGDLGLGQASRSFFARPARPSSTRPLTKHRAHSASCPWRITTWEEFPTSQDQAGRFGKDRPQTH